MSFFNTELHTNYINYDSTNGILIQKNDSSSEKINLNKSGIIVTSDDGGNGGLQVQQISDESRWNFNIYSGTNNDLGIFYNGLNRFYYDENGKFLIKQQNVNTTSGLALQYTSTTWTIVVLHTLGLLFYYNSNLKGYLASFQDIGQIDFTGQHRSLLNKNIDNSSIGLIVSSTGKYVNLDNTLKATINESLPICEITNIENDKKVFGVLSDKEDSNTTRSYSTGNWSSVYNKQNSNEQRMFINSLGEGGIWICNKSRTLENGDYITSSSVPGYGMKQSDGLLHNYTVAKITCECDFSITQIVKQKLKVITTTIEKGNTPTDEEGKTITEIDYDANGNVQYEDDLDENGNQQMIYPLDTRFLLPDGSQITETEYNTKLGNGETVYIGCFVGCTYHCG